jgi:hypothetical protein
MNLESAPNSQGAGGGAYPIMAGVLRATDYVMSGAGGRASGGYWRVLLEPYESVKAPCALACLAVLLFIRDPLLLFAALVATVVLVFDEWRFLIVASSVPMFFLIPATFNAMSGDLVSHVAAAASALNGFLNTFFVAVALIAAWPSARALFKLDLRGAVAASQRFLPISVVLFAKIAVENRF